MSTVDTASRTRTVTAQDPEPSRYTAIMTMLPERILQIVIAVFVAAFAMAAFRVYHPYTVLPLAVILIAVTWRMLPTDVVPTRERARGSLLAIVAGVVWAGIQFPFATEFVVASRDPGIYTNLGVALARTGHSFIDVSPAIKIAQGIPQASAVLGVFGPEADGNVRLQGGDAVPSLLGLGYWVNGIDGLIVTNAILGGVGLIALYALGRRLLGPGWALVPPVILGVSLPMVYFSRAPYTEIISLVAFLSAIIWVWSAFTTGRRREFFMAGVVAGAICLTRIDGLLSMAVLVATFAIILLGVSRPDSTVPLVRSFLAFIVPGIVLTALGAYDLFTNFRRYVHDLGKNPLALWALLIVMVVAAFAIIGVRALLARRARRALGPENDLGVLGDGLGDRGARRAGVVAGALTVLAFAYWLVRPTFYQARFATEAPYAAAVMRLQAAAGLPIDGTRTYDEYSLYWFIWYFGVPFVILAGLGLGTLGYRAISRRRPGLLVVWALTLGVAMLYLNKISITPDQLWAFRRVLPTITPGFLLAAVWPLAWLWRHSDGRRKTLYRVGSVVGVLALVIGTGISWNPHLFRQTVFSNQANEIRAICSTIGDAKDVVFVNTGPDPYPLTLRDFCGVQVVEVVTGTAGPTAAGRAATQGTLSKLATRLPADTPVLAFDATLLPWESQTPPYVYSAIIVQWNSTLLSAPRTTTVRTHTSWIGTLQSGGQVTAR